MVCKDTSSTLIIRNKLRTPSPSRRGRLYATGSVKTILSDARNLMRVLRRKVVDVCVLPAFAAVAGEIHGHALVVLYAVVLTRPQ